MEIYKPKHYILSYKARRKNAIRHIKGRFDTKQACIDYFTNHYNPYYDYTIYTYDWKFIMDLDKNMFKKGDKKDATKS